MIHVAGTTIKHIRSIRLKQTLPNLHAIHVARIMPKVTDIPTPGDIIAAIGVPIKPIKNGNVNVCLKSNCKKHEYIIMYSNIVSTICKQDSNASKPIPFSNHISYIFLLSVVYVFSLQVSLFFLLHSPFLKELLLVR